MNIDAHIEAILFWKAEPISKAKLASILEIDAAALEAGLSSLASKLTDRGITLQFKDDEVSLVTSPLAAARIEALTKDELIKDLGKAGLETVSIILYQSPVSRAEIDYIRGVSSNFILRNLLVRGLIEKISNPADQRSFLYRPTFELLSYLGVRSIEEIPEYVAVRADIEQIKNISHGQTA